MIGVATFFVAMIGVWLASLMWQRKWYEALKKSEADFQAGRPIDLPAAMRIPNEGRTRLGRRWRQGILSRKDGSLKFVPIRPRKAKSFDLAGFQLVGERPLTFAEKLYFPAPDDTLLLGETPLLGTIELGFGLRE